MPKIILNSQAYRPFNIKFEMSTRNVFNTYFFLFQQKPVIEVFLPHQWNKKNEIT